MEILRKRYKVEVEKCREEVKKGYNGNMMYLEPSKYY